MDYAAGTLSGPIDLSRTGEACADQARLLAVMERQGSGLVQMLWRVLGNQADVADAYQETFCRLAILLHEGKSWNKKAFIYRLAANIAIDMLRRRRRQAAAERNLGRTNAGGIDPAAACAQQDELERLQDAIADLPEHLRHVLVLREFGELDYQAIASALQITAASARQYRHRAILKLAEKLKVSRGNTNDVHEDRTRSSKLPAISPAD